MRKALDPAQATLLLVDDSLENLKLLGQLLKKTTYRLVVAQSGKDALEFLEQKPVDLVLLDVMMPGMNGFEVCGILRKNPAYKDMPVLFLTAKADQESINLGLELGGDDYITKPFNGKELLVRVHHHLDRVFAKRQLEQKSQESRELIHVLSHDLANPMASILSFAGLVKEDPQLLAEIFPRIADLAQSSLDLIELIRRMRYLEEKGLEVESVDLAAVLDQVREVNAQKLREKQVQLETLCPPQGPVVVAEHTSLLHSVLNNLVTNAIKFSNPGGKIDIKVCPCDDGQVTVEISDQGVGMPPVLVEQLFDLSKKTSRVGTAGERGTGFGMPLVKKFMDYYGGRVEVVSKEEKTHPEDHGTQVILYFQTT